MVLGKRVAKNVKAIRLGRGFSQQDLADKTGLTVRYISRLENTAPNLTLEVIEKLTKGLGCSPNDLVGGEDDHSMNGSKEMLDQTIRFLQGLRSRL
jgi:transcriptional regulator with XRE-family HTH domain